MRGLNFFNSAIYDADAQNFFNYNTSLTSVQKTAVNNLVIGLKSYGLWTKHVAIYPIVGPALSNATYNLKNPAQYQCIINNPGGTLITYGPSGISSVAAHTNVYLDTGIVLTGLITTSGAGLSEYCNHANDGSGVMSDFGVVGSGLDFFIATYSAARVGGQFSALSGYHTKNLGNIKGFFNVSRLSTANQALYLNGVLNETFTSTATAIPTGKVFLLGANDGTGTATYGQSSDGTFAWYGIDTGLTATDSANLYTVVQAYQTALGRNN